MSKQKQEGKLVHAIKDNDNLSVNEEDIKKSVQEYYTNLFIAQGINAGQYREDIVFLILIKTPLNLFTYLVKSISKLKGGMSV